MVQEAEKYKAEDERQRDNVSSKNSLESSAFDMKATVEGKKLQGFNDEDKQRILESIMKSSTGWKRIRLQRRKNLNTSRRSWRKPTIPSPPSCTRVQVAAWRNSGGFPGGGASPSGGASSGPTTDEADEPQIELVSILPQ